MDLQCEAGDVAELLRLLQLVPSDVDRVAHRGRAAIVIDDLESTYPWRPRAIEVRGRAEAIALLTPLIRIYPERIISWGLEQGRSARTVAR
jgi:pyridoxamine 5'-phosphate oxidase family protein